jgi:hypothetical protein
LKNKNKANFLIAIIQAKKWGTAGILEASDVLLSWMNHNATCMVIISLLALRILLPMCAFLTTHYLALPIGNLMKIDSHCLYFMFFSLTQTYFDRLFHVGVQL